MKVLITGAAGMLGREVRRACEERDFEVFGFGHDTLPIDHRERVAIWLDNINPAVVVNCAGCTPGSTKSVAQMIRSNSLGPQILAEETRQRSIRMIHVSTDCVFSGQYHHEFSGGIHVDNHYTLQDRPDPIDLYGRSKLAGEPLDFENVLTIRTSFVGLRSGLGKWLKEQAGKTIQGWSQAYWNGTSVQEIADALAMLVEDARFGVMHVSSQGSITKAELLEMMADLLGLDVTIERVSEPSIDRTLNTHFPIQRLDRALRRLVE